MARERSSDPGGGRNEVVIVGRLAADAETRVLPSGDQVVSFRVVVDRPARARGPAGRVRVDTIDCAAWRADVRRRVLALPPGSVIEVGGALRRRFWRAGGAPSSRVEVEADRVRRAASR